MSFKTNLFFFIFMEILPNFLSPISSLISYGTTEWFVSQDISNCVNTSGWSVVLTNPQTSGCVWETGVAFPRFLFCPDNTECKISGDEKYQYTALIQFKHVLMSTLYIVFSQ